MIIANLLRKYGIAVAGYAIAAVFLWLYVDARSDVKAEIQRCNLEKMEAVADAQRVVRYAEIEAMQQHMNDLRKMAQEAEAARIMAEETARLAESRPERVRTVIKEVASEDACLNAVIPSDIIDSMRD